MKRMEGSGEGMKSREKEENKKGWKSGYKGQMEEGKEEQMLRKG